MSTMTVKVLDRSTWGTTAPYPLVRTVTISDRCPKCGGKRGEPRNHAQYDNGTMHYIHVWDNPCGHVDHYDKVLKEARERKKVEKAD